MQEMYATIHGATEQLMLPSAGEFVLPGVRWGRFDEVFTPAFWKGQAWQHERLGTYPTFRLGGTFAEELSACLLGGFGMPAELAIAAYSALRSRGLLAGTPTEGELLAVLDQPFPINGTFRRYRFARQKAAYLSKCLAAICAIDEPESDVALRDDLTQLPGIGPKTASWIVRNYRSSNNVAIIDIHILRAGRLMGLFEDRYVPQSHYHILEDAFLQFARRVSVPAAILDSVMWSCMRNLANA